MKTGSKGFSLVELLMGTAVSLVVAGAAVTLFSGHVPLFTRQQDIASLNLGMRNAVSQLQIDLSNAGTGVFPGVNVANWPIGMTLLNKTPAGSCYDADTQTYSEDCFDELNIITADTSTAPVHIADTGASCVSTTGAETFVQAAPGLTMAQTAAQYQAGDQLLFLKGDGSQMTSVILTADAEVSAHPFVRLPHNATGADGVNLPANDPLGISTLPGDKLSATFCTNDWVIKLDPILYRVEDPEAPNGPLLLRLRGGEADVVAERIIGFKAGVTTWNGLATTSEEYQFDPAAYGGDFTLIRSVRVSLIGRTRPNLDRSYTYRNGFDGGPYQIQVASVVVHPRNLSLKD